LLLQDIYSQLGDLQKQLAELRDYEDMISEIDENLGKVRKMLYWHKRRTEPEEGGQGHKSLYYKKGYSKNYRKYSSDDRDEQ